MHAIKMCEGRRVPDCGELLTGSSCLLNWCLKQGLSSLVPEVLHPVSPLKAFHDITSSLYNPPKYSNHLVKPVNESLSYVCLCDDEIA